MVGFGFERVSNVTVKFGEYVARILNRIPSDLFAFLGGVVFAVGVNLATANIGPISSRTLLTILALLLGSALALLSVGHVLKGAGETYEERIRQSKRHTNIGAKWPLLLFLLVFSFLLLFVGLILVRWNPPRDIRLP